MPQPRLSAIACAVSLALNPAATREQEVARDHPTDVVVQARKAVRAPPRDAVDYLRRYCFDPNRLRRRSEPPAGDPDWEPLDDVTRARWGIADPDTPAFRAVSPSQGGTLVLKFEELPRRENLLEHRCTIAVIGGRGHGALPGRMSALFGGPGTRRHDGHADGAKHLAGWRQWLWSGMPGRGSTGWRTVNAGGAGAPRDTWVVVSDPSFYEEHDYILGDLKTRDGGGPPLSMLSFAFTTKIKTGRPIVR